MVRLTGLDFKRRQVKVEFVIGEFTAETIVVATLTVPAGKPDVASVISGEATPVVTGITVLTNKVLVRGTVAIGILYVAAGPEQRVHFFESTTSFSVLIEAPGASPATPVQATVTVEFTSFTATGPRTVDARILLAVRAFVTKPEIVEVIAEPRVEIIPVPQVTRRRIVLEEVGLEERGEVIATGNIDIPAGKPGVREIIHVDAAARVTNVTVLRGKLVVHGVVDVRVLFVADLPGQPVHFLDGRIGFDGFVDMPGIEPGMRAFVTARVADVKVDVVSPRRLRVTAVVELSAVVTFRRDIQFVTSILEDISPALAVTEEFLVQEIVGEKREESIIGARITLPATVPGARRVVRGLARARVRRVTVATDVVIIEGTLAIDVLFVPDIPSQPVFTVGEIISFRATVRVPGARPGMIGFADVDVERVEVTLVDGRTVDVRVVIEAWVLVVDTEAVPVVREIRVGS